MTKPHYSSLQKKVLLPLAVATVIALAALLNISIQDSRQRLDLSLHARAETVAGATSSAAEVVGGANELHRIVSALGAEPGVSMIVVVGGEPAQVLATTHHEWRGASLQSLPDKDAVELMSAVNATRSTQIHDRASSDEFEIATPLHITDSSLGGGYSRGGVVLVRLDVDYFEARQSRNAWRTWSAAFAGLIVIAGLTWWLLNRYVVKPLGEIGSTLRSSAKEEKAITVPKNATNVIARMADSLDETFKTMRAAEARAHAASVAKGEFLARMSHEIRTPMNGVMGMMEALLNTPLDREQTDYLRTAYTSADTLLRLINDILDYSKIEAGKLMIEHIDFDLTQLTDQIVQLWTRRADERGVTLTASIDPRAPRWIKGDPTRLGQVLTNLVSNALKFTPQGSVTIRVELTAEAQDKASLRFAVEDTGLGIPEEAQKHLFTAFMQADGSTSRRFGGTGLGLAICQQLVQLMGGASIAVRSEVGRGSCFDFVLSFDRAIEKAARSHATTAPVQAKSLAALAAGSRILVVDDNETNRKVVQIILQRLGLKCDLAHDGLDAMNDFKTRDYALVLMDCHMPVFDGFEATTAIRRWEQEQGRERTPIVAVSASAFAEDREKCVATGMDDFLAKPITLAGLSGMLEKWLGVSAEETSEPIAESSAQLDSVLTPIQELAVVTELVTTPLSDGDSVEDLFDRAQLDEAQSLLGDAFGEVVGQLDGNAKEAFAGLRDALDKGDADRFRGYAHKFKGSLSTLGALTASKAALALELIGREGNLSEAPRLITDLQVLYDRSYRHLVSLSAGTASATAKSA